MMFIFIPFPFYAQSLVDKTDSLSNELLKQHNDSSRAFIHMNLAHYYLSIEPIKVYAHADSVMDLALRANLPRYMATAETLKGVQYKVLGEYEKSLSCFLRSLEICKGINDSLRIAANLLNIGNLYVEIGDFTNSEKFYLEAFEINSLISDKRGAAIILINLGVLSMEEKEDYVVALRYFKEALQISNELEDNTLIFPTMINIADVYYFQKKYDQAISLLDKVLIDSRKTNQVTHLASAAYSIGRCYKSIEKYDKALKYFNEALQITVEYKLAPLEEQVEEEISTVYSLIEDYKMAYKAQKRQQLISDTLQHTMKKMIATHRDYAEEVSKDNISIRDSKLEYLLWQRWFFIVLASLLLILLVGFGWYSNYVRGRLKSKNHIISTEAHHLDERNHHLKGQLNDLTTKINLHKVTQESEKNIATKKYANSRLEEGQKVMYMKQLIDYINKEKPYLDPDFGLQHLSRSVSISSYHISEVLNETLGKNFYDFVNSYRIEAVKTKIMDPSERHKKLIALAYEVGFNSKTTFNNAFKKHGGMTPSQFRKRYLESKARV